LLQKRRGLATVVGTVFFVIVAASIITYVSYSMDLIDNLAESIGSKQSRDYERQTEEFQVVKVGVVNNKFNFTLQNTGNIPLNVTRLWVTNTTDSTWPVSKFDLNTVVAPGATATNVGQNINLISLNTQSYYMKLVTERGNSQKMFLNSVGEPIYLQLRATPSTVATSFTSSIILEVINTGTNQLLNLQPEIDNIDVTGCTTCQVTLVSGPNPPILDSLNPGDFATFEYEYSFTGEDNDPINFTASLVNGVDEDWAVVTVQIVETAENADVSIKSGGVEDDAAIDDDILLFHMEQINVPSPGYQMMSSDVDGGGTGLQISFDTAGITSFFTNNGSNNIIVPAGNWNASLWLRSAELPASLVNDNTEDMIFHFEDGDGVPPDNSESDSDRDLQSCGSGTSIVSVNTGNDEDAEEEAEGAGIGDVDTGSSDLEMPHESVEQIIGMRFRNLNIPQGATIDGATILFTADESDSGGNVDLDIWGEDTNDANNFNGCGTSCDDISSRTKTSAKVNWDNLPDWTSGEQGPDTTTPELKTIVQEIVDRSGWRSGNDMVFIIEDDGSSGSDRRVAESSNKGGGTPAQITVNWTFGGGAPDWQAGSGPHESGSYYYDGVNECHFSKFVVGGGDGNDIDDRDNTTSLWFKTDGAVTGEQFMVYWGDNNDCPTCDAYHIGLDSVGKVKFEFNTNNGGDVTTCLSTLEYDDSIWHHVVAVRDRDDDKCTLYITNLDGTNPESPITVNNNFGSGNVDADGHWLVGSIKNVDGNWFKGWIDDIIHWNENLLSAAEADELSKTNFGTEAHRLDVNLDITDTNGNFVSNLYTEPLRKISFQDNKGQSATTDSAYLNYNITMSLPQVNITLGQRLNFSMNYVSPTSPWEDLELDMKIDDTGFTPFPSYIQLPFPDNPFPSYVTNFM